MRFIISEKTKQLIEQVGTCPSGKWISLEQASDLIRLVVSEIDPLVSSDQAEKIKQHFEIV